MIMKKFVFVAVPMFLMTSTVAAESTGKSEAAFIACSLAAYDNSNSFRKSLPKQPNLSVLLFNTFAELAENPETAYPVSQTADRQGLLDEASFYTIKQSSRGNFILMTEGSDGKRYMLMLRHIRDEFYDATLGGSFPKAKNLISHRGFCSLRVSKDAATEFASLDERFASLSGGAAQQ